MKAMILAAGKGTRVWPATKTIPKPMIPILGRPIMASLIELFKKHQIDQVVVNTSYLGAVIERCFGDGDQYGVDICYSYEGELIDGELHDKPLGSAGGMKKVNDFCGFFDDTFLVTCGDAWIDLDINAVLQKHREKGGIATVVLQPIAREEVYKYGVVALDADDRVRCFQEKPSPEEAVSNMINTGIYIFEPEIFNYIPADIEYDIAADLLVSLVSLDVPFYATAQDFQWLDIGSISDIWRATRAILIGEITGYRIPGKLVREGLWLGINVAVDLDKVTINGPVVIASGSKIEAGVTINGPTVIGANCVLESGCVVSECLIEDYTRVAAVADLYEKVIFSGHCINREGDFVSLQDWDIVWTIRDSRCEAGCSAIDDSELYRLAKNIQISESDGRSGASS
ncbi:mannose-1-phosphate guanylyltransferase [Sinobacterium caligoides]|uniref:Mannose-1-phosphate guanylyltransferase n=1 Tax=Sinobacterium caligoides TaxID=933926 RepID=A0A3N2DH69_9GAMM|nr:NDP-sugar synthase [Sinobacterium caligoides]ROR99081.1 mannose-1-phosphate guanylyltransferase [Sinobacterium caligoides]